MGHCFTVVARQVVGDAKSAMCLYTDWTEDHRQCLVSLSSGQLSRWAVDISALEEALTSRPVEPPSFVEELQSFQAHDLEAWSCCFGHSEGIFFSGE